MVAIFTGLGSGLVRGSGGALGVAGQLGSALLGRGGEGVSVNAVTGNLVLSRQDEFLVGRGLDTGISRTYNSQGQTGDRDNSDGWQQSSTQRVLGLTGTLNTSASTVQRLSGDGSLVTYVWGARGGVSAYWATDGSGAHDKLVRSGANWLWTDGESQVVETYAVSAGSANYRIPDLQVWDYTIGGTLWKKDLLTPQISHILSWSNPRTVVIVNPYEHNDGRVTRYYP